MYPIDCFNALSSDKLEAVKYFIDLNKFFLKETSLEDYERFSEYLKGAGKDVLLDISKETDDKKLYALLEKLEAVLPYCDALKGKSFEQKNFVIYKEIAKNYVKVESYDRKACLKKHRELAQLYDDAIVVCNKYRDTIYNQRYIRAMVESTEALNRLCENHGKDKETIIRNLVKLATETNSKTREARIKAFELIREYGIKDAVHQLEQERLASEK